MMSNHATQPWRIGVEATCWPNRRGYGRFTRELLRALFDDARFHYVLFVDRDLSEEIPPHPRARVEVVRVRTQTPVLQAASATSRRSLRDLWAMSRAVAKTDLHLFFFPSVYSYFPLIRRVPTLVAIHDTIAESLPEFVFSRRRYRWFWNWKVRAAMAQADLILTVSQYSKEAILQHYRCSPSKIRVVYEAPSDSLTSSEIHREEIAAILKRWDITPQTPFFLYVGGFSPHKNLGIFLETFERLRRDDPRFCEVKILLTGDYVGDSFLSEFDELSAWVREHDLSNEIIFTGFLPDPELGVLYANALALVLPSLYEGFGLPAIEAAVGGTPVIATTASPIREMLGEDGALYFNPRDAEQLRSALVRVLHHREEAAQMGRIARERARQFSWPRCAQETAEIFRSLIRSSSDAPA